MLIVTKKNRQLRIPDEKAQTYINLGYAVKSEDGKVISEPVSSARQISDLKAENEALKAEIAVLRGEADATAGKTASRKKTTATQ